MTATMKKNTGAVRVVKLGGRAQSSLELPGIIAQAWRTAPGDLCIVHGGGDEISALQKKLGSTSQFSGGRRVTGAGDIDIIRMALSGLTNKRLVTALVAAGASAVGISGEDCALISAQPLSIAEFGYVGMPQRINTDLINTLLQNGYMPVISPLASNGSDVNGSALNVNGDDAAAAIAASMHAAELLLIADVAGVLDDNGALIPELNLEESRALINNGIAAGGMAAKLEAAHAALAGGVKRVRIADLAALTDDSCGTVISTATSGATV